MCPNCFRETYTANGCSSCGYVYTPPDAARSCLPPFTVLNERYLIGRVIGSGGFGITYKAYDIYNNQLAAVKEFMPSGIAFRGADYVSILLSSEEDIPVFQHAEKRFIEEAMILMQLHSVDGIVDITDYFYANSTAYFVMPFVEGCHLKELYRRLGKRIPCDLALQFIYQIGMALITVHEQGKLLHRDISPENIMIDVNSKAYLIDFGNARSYISEKSQNMSVLLKPGYAPPEQYSSRGKQGPWTDVYALAATFYFVTTGTPVPDAPDRLLGKPCPLIDELVPECPHAVAVAINDALVPNLAMRTQSMRELMARLSPYIGGGASPHPAQQPQVRQQPVPQPQPVQHQQPPQQPRQQQTIPQQQPPQQQQVQPQPQAPPGKQLKPYLEVIYGEQLGNRWILFPDMDLKIGRSASTCNVVLAKYPQVSSLHCIVNYNTEHQMFFVQDVSTNGTKLDGKPLTKNFIYNIKPGQQISLASDTCIFRLGITE